MKKLKRYLMYSAAVVAALTIAFAGCNDPAGGGTQGGTIDGDTDPDTIKSEKVTEAQWEAAFARSTFRNVSLYVSTEQEPFYKTYFRTTGDKRYVNNWVLEDGVEQTEEAYEEKSGDKYWLYEKSETDASAWVKTLSDVSQCEPDEFFGDFYEIGSAYSMFTYNEAESAYTCFTFDEGKCSIKIAGGKLAALTQEYSGEEYQAKITYLLYDYGNTEVVLPQAITGGGTQGGTIDGDTDPDTIKSEKVTKEQWEAAFARSTFRNVSLYVSTEQEPFYKTYFRTTGDKRYVNNWVLEDGVEQTEEAYEEKSGDKYWLYEKSETDASAWVKTLSDVSQCEPDEFFGDFYEIGSAYSMFTYSEAENAYTCLTFDEGKCSIKIAGGKLAALTQEYSGEEYQAKITYLLYDYGNTEVVLPQASINGEEEELPCDKDLTKDSWNRAFDVSRYYNSTVKSVIDMGLMGTITQTCSIAGNRMQLTMQMNGQTSVEYYQIENGKYYKYQLVSQEGEDKDSTQMVWSKSEANDSVTIDSVLSQSIGILYDRFDAFAYTDGKWVAENITLDIMPVQMDTVSVIVVNGNMKSVEMLFSEGSVTYQVSSVGTTNVTLPEVGSSGNTGESEGSKPDTKPDEKPGENVEGVKPSPQPDYSEEDWKKMFHIANFDECEIEVRTLDDSAMEGGYKLIFEGNKAFVGDDHGEEGTYYECVEEVWYEYVQSESGVWEKRVSDFTKEKALAEILFAADHRDAFHYAYSDEWNGENFGTVDSSTVVINNDVLQEGWYCYADKTYLGFRVYYNIGKVELPEVSA